MRTPPWCAPSRALPTQRPHWQPHARMRDDSALAAPVMGEVVFIDSRRKPKPAELPKLPFTPEDVAGHEARHAAAALMFGMTVTEARADIPDHKWAGWVRYVRAEDLDVRDLMVAILVGAIGDKSVERWPPAWPPNPDAPGDEGDLARLAEDIVLTEYGYGRLCDDARRLVADPEFRA